MQVQIIRKNQMKWIGMRWSAYIIFMKSDLSFPIYNCYLITTHSNKLNSLLTLKTPIISICISISSIILSLYQYIYRKISVYRNRESEL